MNECGQRSLIFFPFFFNCYFLYYFGLNMYTAWYEVYMARTYAVIVLTLVQWIGHGDLKVENVAFLKVKVLEESIDATKMQCGYLPL